MTNRTLILTASVFTLILCVLDFSTRLTFAKVDTVDKNIALDKNGLKTVFFGATEKQALANKLAKFDVIAPKKVVAVVKKALPVKPKINLLTAQQQQAQQGKLWGLFDDKFKYTLIATFDNNGKQFAFFEQKNLLTETKQKIRIFLGEKLANYQLTQVDSNSVKLVQGEQKIQLQLFLIKR